MSPSIKERKGLLIDQEWLEGSGGRFSSHNPATGELLWQGKGASPTDVDAAVQSALEASRQWANVSIRERFRYLAEFSQLLRSSQARFSEIISMETGKPLWDSMGEVEAMIHKSQLSLDAYERRCAELKREQPHAHSITRHRPHGTVAVLGPYNFPGHLPNGHIMPALLAGNTIVFKPSELTPLAAEETLALWQSAGLPKGVLNLVQGGIETGKALVNHPRIQGLFFTGSYQTGRHLSASFGADPAKILALEMGGNNPLVVGQISDLQAAAYIILQSAFLSSGQRCTCARRLIIPDTWLGEELLQTLIKMIERITIGPYTQKPEPFMGPVITEIQAEKLLHSQEALLSKGGKVLHGMRTLPQGKTFLSPGLMDVTPIPDRPDEEIFGPFLQVIRVGGFQEALQEANRTQFGLSAGLLSQQPEEYALFYEQIQAGVVNWNAPLTGASSAAPFGGIKCSGNHRPSAYYAADYCSYPVASLETPQLKLPAVPSPGLRLT